MFSIVWREYISLLVGFSQMTPEQAWRMEKTWLSSPLRDSQNSFFNTRKRPRWESVDGKSTGGAGKPTPSCPKASQLPGGLEVLPSDARGRQRVGPQEPLREHCFAVWGPDFSCLLNRERQRGQVDPQGSSQTCWEQVCSSLASLPQVWQWVVGGLGKRGVI